MYKNTQMNWKTKLKQKLGHIAFGWDRSINFQLILKIELRVFRYTKLEKSLSGVTKSQKEVKNTMKLNSEDMQFCEKLTDLDIEIWSNHLRIALFF